MSLGPGSTSDHAIIPYFYVKRIAFESCIAKQCATLLVTVALTDAQHLGFKPLSKQIVQTPSFLMLLKFSFQDFFNEPTKRLFCGLIIQNTYGGLGNCHQWVTMHKTCKYVASPESHKGLCNANMTQPYS